MKRRMRNTGQVVPMLLTFTMLLATCGGSNSCTISTPVMGDFTGHVSGLNADIGLSTDGQSLTALATDGTDNTIKFFLWFDGPVTNNAVNLNDKYGKGALVVTLTAQAASGTVTYQGKSYDFNAAAVTDPSIRAGLYSSEQTVSGVLYQAGWVVLPTPTKSQEQRRGIINEQTKALVPAPALTAGNIASGQVVVPGLGVFMPTLFQSGKPVVTPSPTQVTVTAPPVLSVSPGSFSLPGEKYCSFDSTAGLWNCTATLTNSGQSNLNWSASSSPSGVTFNPPSGILSAGQTTSVIISLSRYYCASSTLMFSGPGNSVTVSVSCPPPVLSVSPGSFSLPGDKNCSFDSTAGSWNCTATLTNSGQSDLNWSASSSPSGVTFNPPSGILSAGQTTSVIISLSRYYCASSTLMFSGPGNSVTVSVSCPPQIT